MTQRDGARQTDPQGSGPAGSGPSVPKLTIAALALLIAGLGVVSSIGSPGRRRAAAMPPRDVDLDRYLGLWHEFARSDGWFARRDENVVLEYERRPDGLIRVVKGSNGSGVGGARRREARARVIAGTGNARFKLAIFGPFFFGNHWVLDHGEAYDWSIVGDGPGRSFSILTRAAVPAPHVQAMLFARARALGYDTSRLRRTRQTPH